MVSDCLEVRPAASRFRSIRKTNATVIYEALFQSIATMELLPGAPLQEKVLTQRFNVSRTPVREALLHLSRDGLVDLYPQSGTFVSRIDIGALRQTVVIRRALEAETAMQAATLATASDLARLDMVLARQRLSDEVGDPVTFHEADESFHATMAAIARYETVWELVRQTKVQIDRVRRLTLPAAGRMKRVIAEHLRIREAIAAKNPEAAVAALHAHLSVIVPDVDQLGAQYPDYFVGRAEPFAVVGASASPSRGAFPS